MNKSIIALAVAGALAASAAAQAETTLYGSARIGVTYTQPHGPGPDKSSWDVANEASRIGVKGSEDLGGGLKVIYQYEFGVNIDGGTNDFASTTAVDKDGKSATGKDGSPLNRRLSSVGLTGGFGTVVLGRVWSAPYLYVGSLTDVFNSSSSGQATVMGWDRLNSTVGTGTANTGSSVGGDRVSDVVAYITPTFSGFSGAGAIVMNGNGTNSGDNREDIDAYDIAGGYTLGGLSIGASYRDFKALDYTQWTVGAAYKFPFGLRFAGTYSDRDVDGKNTPDPSVWDLVAEYNFGANTVRAGYASYDHDMKNVSDVDAWRVGYQYDLSKRTRLWVEYLDESNIGNVAKAQTDRNFLSIGMRHDF